VHSNNTRVTIYIYISIRVVNYLRIRISSTSTRVPAVTCTRNTFRTKKRPPSLVGFSHSGSLPVPSIYGNFCGLLPSSRHRSFPIKSHYCREKLKGARACFSISRTTRQKPICSAAMPRGIHAHK